MKQSSLFHFLGFTAFCLLLLVHLPLACAQEARQKPAEKRAGTPATEKATAPSAPQLPAQIELLETHIRFEANGDSRKEVHTRVRINNELGVNQFARLNFDFNRSFESIEIPMVHITHASGGTADILPSAITDNPNPAVVNFPAYQDVRVKSVRILGLEPGDLLEYRVITNVSHHPLATDFWLDHSFDRTGVVAQEIFVLDLPASRQIQIHFNEAIPNRSIENSGEGNEARRTIRWNLQQKLDPNQEDSESDVALTTFASWRELAKKLEQTLRPDAGASATVQNTTDLLVGATMTPEEKIRALYDFTSQKIATINLPLGATGFRTRAPKEILQSNVGTPEDKFALFHALTSAFAGSFAALTGSTAKLSNRLPRPSLLSDSLVLAEFTPPPTPGAGCGDCYDKVWLDLALEVAPFQAIPASLRGKEALVHGEFEFFPDDKALLVVPGNLPFNSTQKVAIDARLSNDGALSAKVKYTLRGDNELLLRVAFHQTPKEKWNDVAQLLALSDGFRGKIASVEASDPSATKEPFTVRYEIEQPKFVDWSKKPVRIPALLPQVALPDPPAKPATGSAVSPIELGTPLDVETHVTLHLPPGTTALTPTGISVTRDYATFASKYSATGPTLTASRHINFLLREVPATRIADYNTFLRAVQNDQAQDFTLDRAESSPAKMQSPARKSTAPKKP